MKFNLDFFLLFNCFVFSSFIIDTLSYNLKVILPINNKNQKIISCCYMNINHNDDDYNGNIPLSMKFDKNQVLQMSNINDDDYNLIDKNDYVVDDSIQNDIYSIELNELFHQKQPKQQVQQQLHEKNDIITSYILSTLFILSTIIVSTSIKVVHASTTTTLFENINKISLSSSSPLSLISSSNAPSDIFNPLNFQPVCPASDNFYQLLKSIINIIIGSENIVEYGPLIASVLLRVRLELCVFESFLYEAVIPFIKVKGITWILPLHETLETFIAGTIFAISSNFILVGSTKIFSIVLLYIDALIGMMMMMMLLTHFYPYHNLHHL